MPQSPDTPPLSGKNPALSVKYYTSRELSERFRISVKTLANWRTPSSNYVGPPFVRSSPGDHTMTPGRRMTQKTAKKIKPAASSEVAWHAAELRVERMKGLIFAEALLSRRAVEKFAARNSNAAANSIAQMRAAGALDHRARAILRAAPIRSPADAIAALRFFYEWHEQGHDTYKELFGRAIKVIQRHATATASRV
jgi:hypothetical protein